MVFKMLKTLVVIAWRSFGEEKYYLHSSLCIALVSLIVAVLVIKTFIVFVFRAEIVEGS